MAKTKPDIARYFRIVKSIRAGVNPSDDDMKFYYSTTPDIDEGVINRYVEEQRRASKDPENYTTDPDLTSEALVEVGRMLQSDPIYKEQTLRIAKETEAGEMSDKIAKGINLVLGGTDIGNSIAQIREGDKAVSRRPSRPAAPRRDQLLQQAMRQAQEGQFDAARATAPVEAQIQDQYLSDIQGAKTASTGQAGAYGAYRQVAANRRNRAAMDLAPIQDQVRRGQEERYDNLLGMRQAETQNMYRNQAALYPYELNQYQKERQAAALLGSTGRSNLRGSLYNTGNQLAGAIGSGVAEFRHNRLRNQAIASGMSSEDAEKYIIGTDNKLRDNMGINYRPNYNPQYYEQSYIG